MLNSPLPARLGGAAPDSVTDGVSCGRYALAVRWLKAFETCGSTDANTLQVLELGSNSLAGEREPTVLRFVLAACGLLTAADC